MPQSQYQLAIMYNNGDGAPVSSDLYAYWARAAADNGHAGAQFEVAMIIFNEQRAQLRSLRITYFGCKKRLIKGFAAAENNLGLAYQIWLMALSNTIVSERSFGYGRSAAQGHPVRLSLNLGVTVCAMGQWRGPRQSYCL